MARTLDQKTQPYESLFSGSCHSARTEERSDAVERHPPVIPTAVEGSLLLRASAAANLKFSFRRFPAPTATQTHPILPAQGDAKSAAPTKSKTQLRNELLERDQP